jgi:hypothetical protein
MTTNYKFAQTGFQICLEAGGREQLSLPAKRRHRRSMIQNIERRQQASKEKNHEIWTYPICCGLRTADWLCNSTRKKT